MQITKIPEPYSPAFGEVLYALSLQESEIGAEVSIFNSSVTEKIGVKKVLEASEFTLNISDYLRSQVAITPFPTQPCGIIEADERTFYSCIAHENRVSTQAHTAGIVPIGTNEPMCAPGVRRLAENEQDELTWIAQAGSVFARARFGGGKEPIEIPLGHAEAAEPRMLALIVNGGDLARRLSQQGRAWEDFARFTVELHFDYKKFAAFDYRILPKNPRKTRLAWWNRQGGVDLHSFESTLENRLFEKGQGRVEKILRTACTTKAQARRLSEIVGSPRIWIVDGDTSRPVKISGEKPFPVDDEAENLLEIHIEESDKIPFPTL